MNTHIASKSLEIIAVSKEEHDSVLRGPDNEAGTMTLIAKYGNSEVEIGRAWLYVPHREKAGSQALFYIQEISTLTPDMELVRIVLLEKARDLFPKHNIVVSHDGKIPEGIKGLEPFSSGLSILVPSPVTL